MEEESRRRRGRDVDVPWGRASHRRYYWKKLKRYWKKGDKMALGAVPDWDDATRDFDPEEHCLAKSLDGLFFLARQAEKALRDSVGAIADRLIQAVFKPLTSFFSLIKRPLKREIDDGAKVKKNPVTLALRKARKARKRATKWFQAQFEDDEDDDEEEPLGPNMDANESRRPRGDIIRTVISAECPRRSRGVAATRLHGVSTS